MNTNNEHKALLAAIDTVDDTWKPITLGIVVSLITIPLTMVIVLILKLLDLITWRQASLAFPIFPLCTLAVLWLVYGLRIWGLSMDMLSVKSAIIQAARSYADSLNRLAKRDMDRPEIEQPHSQPEPTPQIEEQPIKVGLPNGEYKMIPATSIFEHSTPYGVKRRDHVENTFANQNDSKTQKKAILVNVRGDGSILIDKRDIVRVVTATYEGGNCSARHWSQQLSQQRYSQPDGRKTQQEIHRYLISIGLLIETGKTVTINPEHTLKSALAVLGV